MVRTAGRQSGTAIAVDRDQRSEECLPRTYTGRGRWCWSLVEGRVYDTVCTVAAYNLVRIANLTATAT